MLDFVVQHFDSIDSTNKEVLRQAANGASEGLVVTAQKQTSGKGRLGRAWLTVDDALAMSILLKPDMQPVDVPKLSLLTAVALHEALSKFVPNIGIKWPNDLLIDGKKVSGILTEMRCKKEKVQAVVLGIGINIKAPVSGWPNAIQQPAIDLETAAGRAIDLEEVKQAVLVSISIWYQRFIYDGFAPIHHAWWVAHLASGKMVSAYDGESYIKGIATALADDGALCLLVNGEERRIIAGDVAILDGEP